MFKPKMLSDYPYYLVSWNSEDWIMDAEDGPRDTEKPGYHSSSFRFTKWLDYVSIWQTGTSNVQWNGYGTSNCVPIVSSHLTLNLDRIYSNHQPAISRLWTIQSNHVLHNIFSIQSQPPFMLYYACSKKCRLLPSIHSRSESNNRVSCRGQIQIIPSGCREMHMVRVDLNTHTQIGQTNCSTWFESSF